MDMTLEFEYLKNETQNAILGYPHGALFAGEKHVVVAQTRVGAVGNTEIFAAGTVVSLPQPQPNKETHHEPSHRIQSHPRASKLGRHQVRWCDAPHMPHAWECGFMI